MSSFEDFYDMELDLENCGSLADNFQRFTSVQQLTNEDHYDTKFGKQDALLHIRFTRLPLVLHFHLQHFHCDKTTQNLVKIND
jgi:hypothetical protein